MVELDITLVFLAFTDAGIVSWPVLIETSPNFEGSCDLESRVKNSILLSFSFRLFLHIQSLISLIHASSLDKQSPPRPSSGMDADFVHPSNGGQRLGEGCKTLVLLTIWSHSNVC